MTRGRINVAIVAALIVGLALVSNAQSRMRFVLAGGGGGGGSGCNGACIVDETFDTTRFPEDRSAEKSGGGACTGYSAYIPTGSPYQGWITNGNFAEDGTCTGVRLDANYSGGAGGRGLYHRRNTGSNAGSGGTIKLSFTSQSELWISYVVSYVGGIEWTGDDPGYTKDLDARDGAILILGYQVNGWGFNTNGSNNYDGTSTSTEVTWLDVYPTGDGDGHWFCMDYYFKFADSRAVVHVTSSRVNGGTPVKVIDRSDINFAGRTNVGEFALSNQSDVTVAGGTQFDDIRIDNNLTGGATDRIGCAGF